MVAVTIEQAIDLQNESWGLVIFFMTMLSAYTGLQLAGQIAAERGAERRVWMFSASAVAAYTRFAVQLALVRLIEGDISPNYDVRWMVIGYAVAVIARYVVFGTLTSAHQRLRSLLLCAALEAVSVIATQMCLFRAGHIVYHLSNFNVAVVSLLTLLTCIFGLMATSNLIHGGAPTKRWYRAPPTFFGGAILYFLLLRFAMKTLLVFHQASATYLDAPDNLLEVHRSLLLLLIVFAPILAVLALVAVFLQGRGRRWGRDLRIREEQGRVETALAEQRVIRLQNETLLVEIRERKRIEAELTEAAFHDAVTGLPNRAYLMKRLREKLGQRNRTGAAAILYIDIDRFKSVNDMLGHSQGDQLLVVMGKRLRACMSDKDTLASMGGDEFIILLDRVLTDGHGLRFAQRILNTLEEPIEIAGTTFNLSASIGLCILEPSYSNAETVLRDGDLAMYAAKRKGGAQVATYDPAMLAETMAALNAKTELLTAIERSEFVLFYQPLVYLDTGVIYGVEALIRWMHPNRGMVSPGAFIPLAEETGHIVDIGNWVLRQACTEYAQLKDAASKHLLLSLNVSSRQLDQPSFLDLLKRVLHETGIPPRRLQLELTESIVLTDPARIGTLFEEIRALGVKIAFDDFGTGYSSLSYIQRYPVDTLKIDQSFVRALKNGPVNLDIVRLMLQLAQVTGMSVCAEGIETKEEAASLLAIGCKLAQGYLFSRPMSMEQSLKYLERTADDLVETKA